MYGNEWLDGAKELKKIAIQKMSFYQNLVMVENHFSDEFVESSCNDSLLDYADYLINEIDKDEDLIYLGVAIKFGLVDFTDSDMDTIISINISKFEILEDIINSYQYYHYELSMSDWERGNQIEFIVSLMNIYFSDESQRVIDIWDEIPWGNISTNVIDIFEESLLKKMSNIFSLENYTEEAFRVLLLLG